MDKFEVITYKEEVAFKYTLPEEETPKELKKEMTLVWEGTLESFFEDSKRKKPYKVDEFNNERAKDRFIANVELESDKLIDEVEEEISRKMKFSFDYTSPTYED